MIKLTDEQRKQLVEEGFVHIPMVLDSAEVDTLCDYLEGLWQSEGERAGSENYVEQNTRRLANLSDKGTIFRDYFSHPLVLDACQTVMGENIRLSMFNARDALAGTGARQLWHCDTDHSGIPDESGYYACTAIWMLDDFTEQSGATYLVPRTHRSGKVPKQMMEDRYAPYEGEIRALGKRGDVFIFNGHCWHAGGANYSNHTRRALLAHYLRTDWLPTKAERPDRRQMLSAETVAGLSEDELRLLGYFDD